MALARRPLATALAVGTHTGNSAKAQREKLPKSTHEQLPCHRPQTARNRQSTAAATDTKGSPAARRKHGPPRPRAARPAAAAGRARL